MEKSVEAKLIKLLQAARAWKQRFHVANDKTCGCEKCQLIIAIDALNDSELRSDD